MSVDLKAIEHRLNNESGYQREFLKDPVRLLQKEGLALTDAMATKLRKFADNLSGAQPEVAGSNVGASSGNLCVWIELKIERR